MTTRARLANAAAWLAFSALMAATIIAFLALLNLPSHTAHPYGSATTANAGVTFGNGCGLELVGHPGYFCGNVD